MRNLRSIISGTGLLVLCVSSGFSQTNATSLPSAPGKSLSFLAQMQTATPSGAAGQVASAPAADGTMTRQQAEQMALKNNPRVSVSQLLAMAQKQVVRETRSYELPNLNGVATVVGAEQASRISSGSLEASRMLNHAGAGLQLTQLITDFGRTRNLVASSSLQAKASLQSTEATREDIVLAVDMAFYSALEAQATLKVAQSTVQARQSVSDQVGALTASKLRSTLDQSFADVNLSQAKLLLLDAQDRENAAMAQLDEVLGLQSATEYTLVDDTEEPPSVPPSFDSLIAMALQQRPDLQAQKLRHDADVRFAHAQRDQLLPTISALGVVGYTPFGSPSYFNQDWYGAAGVSMSIPIFNGFRYHAQAEEADLRARASDEVSRQLTDVIVRDVRTAWLNANSAQQRMAVTKQLVNEANMGLDLAQTRYNLGLSSIVELSQAQLQQTQAQIDDANARLQYESDLATIRFQTGTQP